MRIFTAFISLLVFSATAIPFPAIGALKTAGPTEIRLTPPAPKFSETERRAELARRRSGVAAKMADKSTLILFSAQPKLYANDVNYVFRQENNLYYLTNLKQGEATLVINKDGQNVTETLYIPKRNPGRETWNGRMYSNEEVVRTSGIAAVREPSELKTLLQTLKETKESSGQTIYLLLPESERDEDGIREFGVENTLSKDLTGYKIQNAQPIFAEVRYIKSPYELKLLQHAIDITTEAQMRSMAMVGRAKMEYEVQAEVEYTFRRRNADFWGYPSIVGGGPNATTLHYEEAQGGVKPGELLLIDVGAEYDHYTADVTRTFPVNGKFTKEQAEIYQIVYDAQEAVAKAAKPGVQFGVLGDAADQVIKTGLAKLGLIESPDATYQIKLRGQLVTMPQFKFWFMHGIGHWVGMNVHDVGDYEAVLKPGMVFTNEPGIYIREEALGYLEDTPANKAFIEKVRPAFEKYKNIGVRIEDDMIVTETGVDWMTKNLPRKMSDIEAFMAAAPKKFPYTAE